MQITYMAYILTCHLYLYPCRPPPEKKDFKIFNKINKKDF